MKVVFPPIINYSNRISVKNDINQKPFSKISSDSFCRQNCTLNMTAINFKGVSDFKDNTRKHFESDSYDDFISYLYAEIKKRAYEKGIHFDIAEEVVQNALFQIVLYKNEFDSGNITQDEFLAKIDEIYITLRPSKNDYVTDYNSVSLYEVIGSGSDDEFIHATNLAATISQDTYKEKMSYLREASWEERRENKEKIAKLISNAKLTSAEQDILSLRYSKDTLIPYSVMAEETGFSRSYIFYLLNKIIFKIQADNHCVPKKTRQYIKTFARSFNLDYNVAENILKRRYELIYYPVDFAVKNIDDTVQKFESFGLTKEKYLALCIKQPSLFEIKADTIEKHIDDTVQKFESFGLTKEKYLALCIKQPSLFESYAESIEENINDFVQEFENFGITKKQYFSVCLRQPSLFERKAQTLNQNIDEALQYFTKYGLSKKQYFAACIEQPSILCANPQTIVNNVNSTVNTLAGYEINAKDYLKACLAQPSLFCRSPETVKDNIESMAEELKEYEISKKEYIACCIRQPSLFCRNSQSIMANVSGMLDILNQYGIPSNKYIKSCIKYPSLFERKAESIEKNIDEIVQCFQKYGLTKEQYLLACVRQPSLFYHPVHRIQNNVQTFVEEFKEDGLTLNDYLKACVKQPSLLCKNPQNQAQNIRELIKGFSGKGLDTKMYLKVCLRQPTLFYLSKDTVSEHIDIMRFAKLNRNKSIDDEDFWNKLFNRAAELTYSSSLIFIEKLIIPKMFEDEKIPCEFSGSDKRQKLENYIITHPDKKYILNLRLPDCKADVVQLLKEVLSEISKKTGIDNNFEINIVE